MYILYTIVNNNSICFLFSVNINVFTGIVHWPKFKAELRSMERNVDGMKLHREKYSEDFIPYNLPELFQRYEKLEKTWARTCTQIGVLTTTLRRL